MFPGVGVGQIFGVYYYRRRNKGCFPVNITEARLED